MPAIVCGLFAPFLEGNELVAQINKGHRIVFAAQLKLEEAAVERESLLYVTHLQCPVADIVEPPWQAARQAAEKRSSFFAHMLTLTTHVIFPSWLAVLEALATFTIPPELLQTQKVEWNRAKPTFRIAVLTQ